MIVAAVHTYRFAARREFRRHFEWATRLVVLAVGSWIYRVHYGFWFVATGGAGSTPSLTGPVDRVQVVAFFVPYLLITELLLRRGRAARSKGTARAK